MSLSVASSASLEFVAHLLVFCMAKIIIIRIKHRSIKRTAKYSIPIGPSPIETKLSDRKMLISQLQKIAGVNWQSMRLAPSLSLEKGQIFQNQDSKKKGRDLIKDHFLHL